MATVLSTQLANAEAQPPILSEIGILGGKLRIAHGSILCPFATVALNDIYALVRLPSHARIAQIWIKNSVDPGATLTVNIGLYRARGIKSNYIGRYLDASAENGDDAIDGDFDCFANTVSFNSAHAYGEILTQENNDTTRAAFHGLPIWEFVKDIGANALTADPGGNFDVCMTVNSVSGADTDTLFCYSIFYVID